MYISNDDNNVTLECTAPIPAKTDTPSIYESQLFSINQSFESSNKDW